MTAVPEGGAPLCSFGPLTASPAGWRARGAMAISPEQAGKLGQQMRLLPRQFDKTMGRDAAGDHLVPATSRAVSVFANARLLAHEYRPDKAGS
jgi:hypothetical protein